jgi:toxin FitB
MSWLVDTNVLSELSRREPNLKVIRWLHDNEDDLYVSVLTLGELEKGLAMATNPRRRVRLERWIRRDVPAWFEGRILPVDREVATCWGRLVGSLKDPVPAIDSLLAATAVVHQLTLVTRNTVDVARTGADLFNPFD